MNTGTLTPVQTLPVWRETSKRPTVDIARAVSVTDADHYETKIWDVTERVQEFDPTPTGVGCWFVYAPWMHPGWSWYLAAMCHLRPVAGMREPRRQFPDATHEVIVAALNPRAGVFLERTEPLRPFNICQQFDAANDAHARLIFEDSLELVARGQLSLDSDFRPVWEHRLRKSADRPLPPT